MTFEGGEVFGIFILAKFGIMFYVDILEHGSVWC